VGGGKVVGEVTSGGFSPSLQCGIALAYVETAWAGPDKDLKIDVRGQLIDTVYQKGPFYKQASHK
jgi:aminomethyltransferase